MLLPWLESLTCLLLKKMLELESQPEGRSDRQERESYSGGFRFHWITYEKVSEPRIS